MVEKTAKNQPEEKNTQRDPGEKGQACYYVERRGTSSEIASGIEATPSFMSSL